MSRADPTTIKLLKKYDMGKEAVWDCHGTWIVLHKYLEKIAISEKVIINELSIEELNSEKRICVVKCVATSPQQQIITYGESSPHNTKNMYPVAMAEKRAKGRAILKLAGLHGDFYEDEFPVESRKKYSSTGEKKTDNRGSKNESATSSSNVQSLPPGWDGMELADKIEVFSSYIKNATHSGNLARIATPFKNWIEKSTPTERKGILKIYKERENELNA